MNAWGVGEEPWPRRGSEFLPASLSGAPRQPPCPPSIPGPWATVRAWMDRQAERAGGARFGGGRARAAPRSRARAAGIKQAAEPKRVLISGRQLLGITLTEWFCLPAFSTVRRPRAMDQRRGGGGGARGGEGQACGSGGSRAHTPSPLPDPAPPSSSPEQRPAPARSLHPHPAPPRVLSPRRPRPKWGWEGLEPQENERRSGEECQIRGKRMRSRTGIFGEKGGRRKGV